MTPEQCRAARGWLNWSEEDLAVAAAISTLTVRAFEAGRRDPTRSNLETMRVVLEIAGIGFVFQNDGIETTACGITFVKPETGRAH
jgi:ribosome-binding protein aMBF1 (putative translation factor)